MSTVDNPSIPYKFTPRPYQLELFRAMDGIAGQPGSGKRRAMLRWHRRAGKDKCCWAFLIKEASQVPGNYFYIFPTKTMARQALWENIDKDGFKLLDHLPPVAIKRISNQEMLIELTNKSTIRVVGYDKDPDAIRGIACKGAVLSEFAFSDPASYKTLIPAIRESEGWVIFNSTPNGRNHFYEMWQKVFTSNNWFVSLLQTLWPEQPGYSGLISPEQMKEVMEEEGLSQEDVEREYGCSFSTGMKGSYYADLVERAYSTGRITNVMYDECAPVFTYWDIGIDDSDACWFIQYIGNKIHVIDYFEENGQSTDQLAMMLKNKGYQYDTHTLPHDAGSRQKGRRVVTTAAELEDSLKAYGVTGYVDVLVRNPSRQAGIQAVRKRFSRYVFDSESCMPGIKHLELYHRRWDKKRQVFLQEPVHDEHSHGADALRMEAESKERRNDPFYRQNGIEVIGSDQFDPLL